MTIHKDKQKQYKYLGFDITVIAETIMCTYLSDKLCFWENTDMKSALRPKSATVKWYILFYQEVYYLSALSFSSTTITPDCVIRGSYTFESIGLSLVGYCSCLSVSNSWRKIKVILNQLRPKTIKASWGYTNTTVIDD